MQVYASSERRRQIADLAVGSRPHPNSQLLAIAITPAIVTSGNRVQCTVTLADRASDKTTVSLSSSDYSRLSVPATVTIPAGLSSGAFVAQTAHTTTSGKVFITATLDGSARTAGLDLVAAAGSEMLPAPSQTVPAENAAVTFNGPIEFAWSEVMGAASYTIEVACGGGSTGLLAASRTVPASRLTITPLPRGTLCWRVRANDSSGAPGAWSAARPLRVW